MRCLIPFLLTFGLLITTAPLVAQEGNGTVTIETVPDGARVEVNGRHMGRTPLQLQMPAGTTLTVTLQAEGYQPVEHDLMFEAGDPVTLKVTLEPIPAAGAESSSPAESTPPDGTNSSPPDGNESAQEE